MSSVEPNGADPGSVAGLEAALARIPSVTAARVVAGTAGRISEVHLLAKRDRSPKQLVRDVQSVALATFGMEIDYRTVSVVQLEDHLVEAAPPAEGGVRAVLTKVAAEVSGQASEVRVYLEAGGREFVGLAKGPAGGSARLVARATVDAVSPLLGEAAVEVEFADVIKAGEASVALVVLGTVAARGDQPVSGSAVVQRDLHDGVARATLAALNRLASPLD